VNHLSSAVSVRNEDDACRQALVHDHFDKLERSLASLEESSNRLHDRLHSVVNSALPDGKALALGTIITVPMVERLAKIIDRINSINDGTNSVINRLEI
jgi:Mg2+ and Co2+ transporter CorA